MKETKWILLSTVVLSLSIIFSSVYMGNSIKTNRAFEDTIKKEKVNSILITKQETAEYLNISMEAFDELLRKEIREKLSMEIPKEETIEYINIPLNDLDRFIGSIMINNTWYYSKDQIDKWIEYHLHNKS
jgi:hypothetical protein